MEDCESKSDGAGLLIVCQRFSPIELFSDIIRDSLVKLSFRHGKFLGLVTRQNIVQAFNRAAVSLAATGTREPNIFWASGYRVTQLSVPETANGKTLRQLDPRARFAVSVLAVQGAADPDSGFTTIAPDQPLRQGDLLIAAGRSADLRSFRRALETAPG